MAEEGRAGVKKEKRVGMEEKRAGRRDGWMERERESGLRNRQRDDR